MVKDDLKNMTPNMEEFVGQNRKKADEARTEPSELEGGHTHCACSLRLRQREPWTDNSLCY